MLFFLFCSFITICKYSVIYPFWTLYSLINIECSVIVHTTKIYFNRVTIILQRNTFLHFCLYTSLSKDSIYSVVYRTMNSVFKFQTILYCKYCFSQLFWHFCCPKHTVNFFCKKKLHTLRVQLISNFTYVYSYVNTMF